MGRDNIRWSKRESDHDFYPRVFSRKFLSTSGDKMLTLFEDLKSSGAEAHLVEVKYFFIFFSLMFLLLFPGF